MSAEREDVAESGTEAKKSEPWWRRILRFVLFAVGVLAVVLLVRDAGPRAVLDTVLRAGVWLPAVLALEAAWMSMDVFALRALFGDRRRDVPFRVWLRSAGAAYAVMVFLPAGRAGGEVLRAAQLAPYVGGGGRAAATATRLQAVTLLANTFISIPCAIAVFSVSGPGDALGWMVAGNGLVTAIIAIGIVLASRRSRVGGWLGQKIGALGTRGHEFDDALRGEATWARPIAFACTGRVLQALQYGLLLAAVGGQLGLTSALVSQGIHLVGAGLGDLVPNQAGVTEGAYRVFAPALGLAHAPASAIGIALLARICQYTLGAIGWIVQTVVGRMDKGIPGDRSQSAV